MAPIPGYSVPLVMLLAAAASLLPTFTAWHAARSDAEQDAKLRFEARAADIASAIRDRMLDYEQALRGAAGLFAASERVSRGAWSAYVGALRIERAYPGMQGIGFAPYSVVPAGARGAHVPALYLLPLDERNRRALGYDMYSEPIRRRAMDQARDSGEAAISGAVTPAQDAGVDAQPGFVLYMPVYRNGAAVSSVGERRRALAGFVFSPFHAGDLVAGIVGRNPGVEVRLTDVTPPGPAAVLFRDAALAAAPARAPRFSRSDALALRDRVWQLETAILPSLEAEIDSSRPQLILAGGLAISALLLVVVWTLLTTREHARELARDMTSALRVSEERLQLALASANADIDARKAVERLKSEFFAVVGHKLRTPLTSMLASLALLREGSVGELPPDARNFVEIAYDNSERLADLVNDILDIERIEAGRIEIRPEPLELEPLLRRAIEQNAAYAERFGVYYLLSASGGAARVRADAQRLMQVLTNLLSNAAKHSPRGAEVVLEVSDAGAAARIAIADRGPGIAPEFRARLFGKFEQAGGAKGGTGLGLAISKGLIERMDGRIGCDSELGRGSTFWIELPKA